VVAQSWGSRTWARQDPTRSRTRRRSPSSSRSGVGVRGVVGNDLLAGPACNESFRVSPASIAETKREVLVEWGINTRWLSSRLACGDPWGRRVRVGGGSRLEVGVLVEERNFAEFSGEIARDHLGKCHEPGPRVGCHGEVVLERSGVVSGTNPGPEDEGVAAVQGDSCLIKIEAVEFAMRSSTRSPTWHASCQCFRPATYQGEYPR
jgi:hypothetical protein